MNTTKLKIPSGDNSLHARLETPDKGKMKHLAIFAHCFTCNSDLGVVRNISKTLTAKGIGVLRFDFTGLGKSEGEFADTNFSKNVLDLIHVYEFLKDNFIKPSIMIGHSLGGAAILAAACNLTEIEALVTIGAPSEPIHVKHLFDDNLQEIEVKGKADVSIGGRSFEVKKQFLDDLENRNFLELVGELRRPYLIMHSPQDTIVSIDNAGALYKAAFHPKSFITLDGADHIVSNKEDAIYVAEVVATWVSRYLPKVEEEQLSTMGEEAVAHLDLMDGFSTDIYTSNHYILADEPKSVGGTDLGPAPYDLINGGLGACTVMTVKLYAERKKWDLKEVFVYLSHCKKSREELELEEGDGKPVDVFTKKIKFIGDLDDKQRNRLKDIASKCPVHRTLINDVIIQTELLNE